jgi:hypothetical protein
VTDDAHGITNVVAEGINSKFMYIKRRAGRYRNIENFQKPSCSTPADSISTHGDAGWTIFSLVLIPSPRQAEITVTVRGLFIHDLFDLAQRENDYIGARYDTFTGSGIRRDTTVTLSREARFRIGIKR